jgi:pimeloyl-ACP methyl ester carboxylesterase
MARTARVATAIVCTIMCTACGGVAFLVPSRVPRLGHPHACSHRALQRRHPLQASRLSLQSRSEDQSAPELQFSTDCRGRPRLKYCESGWKTWSFSPSSRVNASSTLAGAGHKQPRACRVNYIQHGENGVPVVFVHGFGASAFHWRYQIADLAKTHRVFSLCLLGFGHSEKPGDIDYGHRLWGEQVHQFIKEVVGEPAVVVGNSLGGIVSLQTAVLSPTHVLGLVLMNVPGNFVDAPHAV